MSDTRVLWLKIEATEEYKCLNINRLKVIFTVHNAL